jgi:uncharacterized membrane protein
MPARRRTFLKWSAAAGGFVAAALTDDAVGAHGWTDRPGGQAGGASPSSDVPALIRALRPMTAGIVPISARDRQARIEKARRLMAENHIDAIILEGISSAATRRRRSRAMPTFSG